MVVIFRRGGTETKRELAENEDLLIVLLDGDELILEPRKYGISPWWKVVNQQAEDITNRYRPDKNFED